MSYLVFAIHSFLETFLEVVLYGTRLGLSSSTFIRLAGRSIYLSFSPFGLFISARIFAMIDRHDTGTISLPMIKE